MSRRRRNGSPFSLFSFQDIVTSVTAVIILMTLLLALELIHRTLETPSPRLVSSADVREAINEAQQHADELRERLRQSGEEWPKRSIARRKTQNWRNFGPNKNFWPGRWPSRDRLTT